MLALLSFTTLALFAIISGQDEAGYNGGPYKHKYKYGVFRGHINNKCPPGTRMNPSYIGDAYYLGKLDANDIENITYSDTLPCLLCPPGAFSHGDDLRECLLCPMGTFSDRVGSPACQPCRPHTFNPFHGQSLCKICSGGLVQHNGTVCNRDPHIGSGGKEDTSQ